LVALALLTFAVCWFAFRLTRFEGVTSLWVANGLLTGVLLVTPKWQWRDWLLAGALGQILARVLIGDSWLQTVGLGAVNLLECGIVAYWVRRHVADLRNASSLGTVARDAFGSTLVACLVSATLGLPMLLTRPGVLALPAWGNWFSAHMLGMVIFATLTVCAFQRRGRMFGARGRRLDFTGCVALLSVVSVLAFGQESYSLLFLVYLPFLLLAFRHGLSGMLVGTVIVAGISGYAAAQNMGSFALRTGDPMARILYWQIYIAAGCLLAYSTAVAMTERRQFERRLVASQAQLQAITDHLPALVARFDRDVRYVYANPRSREMAAGIDLIGKSLPDLRGPEHYAKLKPYVDAVLRGETQQFETWLDTPGGRIELRAQFVPDRAADGRVQGFYSLSFDITAAKAAERELERQARVDALTGLANRRHFEEDLSAAVARATRTGAALLVVSLDLDRFKQINDNLGHAVGDEVLKEFARRVRASVYDVDLVARLGGDEFVVLVEYSATAEAGERIARHLIEAMVPPFRIDGRDVPVATSVGVGLHQPVVSAAALMALADKALYEAKANGRNTWSLCRG
jgi:diguanylate cyclase (GGDEF)-like protein/PAS domain S-box-containing protein